MDPRGSFVKHMSRDFIQSEDAISPEALASITSKSSADAAVVQNALRFDTDRKKEDNLVRQAEKGLFHPLKATLSSTSLGQVKNLNLAKFEAAEVARDLDYLVKAIIQSHSTAAATGTPVMVAQELLLDRVALYLACKRGTMTLERYLATMNDHIIAIKGMDSRVDDNNEGGYLGTRSEQVTHFLRGTGATKVINTLKNGNSGTKIPLTLEDVCLTLTNWSGEIYEPGDKKNSESIMTLNEADDEEYIYGIGISREVSEGEASPRRTAAATRAKDSQRKANKLPATPATAVKTKPCNPGGPAIPLIRTEVSLRPSDRVCDNCGGYHPDPRFRMQIRWISCPSPWNEDCIAKNKAFEAKRAAERGARTEAPRAATIGHVTSPDAAPMYTPDEAAAAHAMVMEMRTTRQQYAAYTPADLSLPSAAQPPCALVIDARPPVVRVRRRVVARMVRASTMGGI